MGSQPVTDSKFVAQLFEMRKHHAVSLPSKTTVVEFIDDLLNVLFSQRSTLKFTSEAELSREFLRLEKILQRLLLGTFAEEPSKADELTEQFFSVLPKINDLLIQDAQTLLDGDPAARTIDEVIAAYPGFFAVACYRLGHFFYQAEVPYIPRLITEYAHQFTGIDIHPGARIGTHCYIDHGTGIVIGETCDIGNHVKIYQGVTLGALSVEKSASQKKRHPTVEDHVIIYSNATILGGNTTIGHHSIVGGNVWLTSSIPPYSTAYQTSGVSVKQIETQKKDGSS